MVHVDSGGGKDAFLVTTVVEAAVVVAGFQCCRCTCRVCFLRRKVTVFEYCDPIFLTRDQ